ncbi:hypothetical protein L218DRAFT_946832 [Marasmius fiardii PR-910]|nr:hypothetical protein L218DRAFT_946832 [Marasmius fiardii PR-910]
MFDFPVRLFTLVIAACIIQVYSAPLHRRQIGSIQCNVARLQTVQGLSATSRAVDQLVTANANDSAVASSLSDAQTGLASAKGGVRTIAQAILSGQNAPADARDQVGTGLTSAASALSSISSDDPNVSSGVQNALAQLAKTAEAGKKVVSLCGGSSNETSTGQTTETSGLSKRQIGSVQCNVARLKTVSNLKTTSQNVDAIATALGSDQATATAVQSAQSGISSAQDGINQIAQAILAGQDAPAAARDQVGQGLTDAKTALSSISSADPAVTPVLVDAQTSLDKTIAAGQDVVNLCKPSGNTTDAASTGGGGGGGLKAILGGLFGRK